MILLLLLLLQSLDVNLAVAVVDDTIADAYC